MKAVRAIFMASLLALGIAGSALAQELIVANGTGFTIHQLGLVDSNSDGEAQDLLGNDTLAAGEGLRINISGDPNGWELIARASELAESQPYRRQQDHIACRWHGQS